MELIPQSWICSVHDSDWYLSYVFIPSLYRSTDGFSSLFSCFLPSLTEQRSEKQLGGNLTVRQGLLTTRKKFVSVYSAKKQENKVICV